MTESQFDQETFWISDLELYTKYFKDEEMFSSLEKLFHQDKEKFQRLESLLKTIIPGIMISQMKESYEAGAPTDSFTVFFKQVEAAVDDEAVVGLFEAKLKGGFEGFMNIVKQELKIELKKSWQRLIYDHH